METICILVVIGITCYIGYGFYTAVQESNRKHRAEIEEIKSKFNSQKNSFFVIMSRFFHNNNESYQHTYTLLKSAILNMESTNRNLINVSQYDYYSDTINDCLQLADDFNAFGQTVEKRLPYTSMMDSAKYGKIRKPYWDSIRSMNKVGADIIIQNCERSIATDNYAEIFSVDIEAILRCIWFYATDKPYSAESFKRAVNIFNSFVKSECIDVTIAELYAMKQMGGEEILRDRLQYILHKITTAERLTLIASALMWLNAYQAENIILQHMLSEGMQMSAKAQERLHALTNGGGKVPSDFNVVDSNNVMYFDVSALTWKDEEYTGLFENLAFREKKLSYSLAVRDEDKDLFLTSSFNVPGISAILSKMNSVFAEEYGNVVTATVKKCIALSGNGEENIEGILVKSNECKQMGILVYVVRIGKKLNIKFYTLFMPNETKLTNQKQQALSLYKKLSPAVAMWESSIKDTTLMAIQQLLNAEPQTTFGGNTVYENDVSPIF